MPGTTQPVDAQIGDAGFEHPALFYRSQQEYLDCLLPFVTDGLDAGQPVLIAVPGPNLAALRDGLGPSAARVVMADMTEVGRNPGRILGEVLSGFVEQHCGQRVRMIGEPIWPARSAIEYPACVQHEALINRAFAGRAMTVACPYDKARLDPNVIADARSTHPVLWQAGSPEQDSATFAPDDAWARGNQPLSTNPTAVKYTVRKLADLSGARAFAAAYAQWFGLSAARTADLQLIANELATVSVMHAGSACRLALWQHDGQLVCEARDTGHLDDPMAGRRPYWSDTSRGQGLCVVNGIADLVRIHTTTDATTIQAFLSLDQRA
ncbi:MAG: anti-sigma factor RsbA family regulatory protein [Mycobacterium sp.]